jgi:hypothetical protein
MKNKKKDEYEKFFQTMVSSLAVAMEVPEEMLKIKPRRGGSLAAAMGIPQEALDITPFQRIFGCDFCREFLETQGYTCIRTHQNKDGKNVCVFKRPNDTPESREDV